MWVERAGETAEVSRGGETPGGSGAQQVTQAFERAGLRTQQRGGGGGTPTPAPAYVVPGEYQVLLRVGDRTLSQTLRVIQP
jgi:hypothetical protein